MFYLFRAQRARDFEEWFENLPVFDSIREAFDYGISIMEAAEANAREESMVAPEQEIPKSMVPPEQEISTSMVAPEEEIRISMVAPEQEVVTGGQEEIARNAKKWMTEEAIVAFKKYMEKRDDSKVCIHLFIHLFLNCFYCRELQYLSSCFRDLSTNSINFFVILSMWNITSRFFTTSTSLSRGGLLVQLTGHLSYTLLKSKRYSDRRITSATLWNQMKKVLYSYIIRLISSVKEK